ncbi:MAG: FHA domain-containing protein, partial [Deltaproteobacteria bacterium]|nr:FHA domain-containing protein [Deltaproteobacteria bacterium]
MSESAIFCGSISEAGRRPNNDDDALVNPDDGIFVVCDGAGGKMGGRTAAELICRTVSERSAQIVAQIPAGVVATQQAVHQVLMAAHHRIIEQQTVNPALSGMTSTVAMVVNIGPKALVTHVGDSRVYLYRSPELWQMTHDHNLENYLEDNPQHRPKVKRPGKTLLQALGLKTDRLNIEQSEFDLEVGDILLLCSDGVTDSVPGWTLRDILEGVRSSTPQEVAAAVGRASLRHGTMDNYTAVVLHLSNQPHEMDGPKTAIFDLGALSQGAYHMDVVLGWLAFVDGPQRGNVIQLEGTTVIGANVRCPVHLDDGYVSSRHAEIFRVEHGFKLRDLGSTNGTHLNNTKVYAEREVALIDGDIVKIGTTEMVF